MPISRVYTRTHTHIHHTYLHTRVIFKILNNLQMWYTVEDEFPPAAA